MEDCIGVFDVSYPEFPQVYFFDHSCGYDRKRDNTFNTTNMNGSFGETKLIVHDVIIKEVGLCANNLSVGGHIAHVL